MTFFNPKQMCTVLAHYFDITTSKALTYTCRCKGVMRALDNPTVGETLVMKIRPMTEQRQPSKSRVR